MPSYVQAIRAGHPFERLVADVVGSSECRDRHRDDLTVALPDLTALCPDRYSPAPGGGTIYHARDDAGIAHMAELIARHRCYDSFAIWRPEIDTDKRVTAAVVAALGATNLVELGCFSGSVLALLKARGIAVTGVELSHRAFLLAQPSVYHDLRFGDLLSVDLPGGYDAFLAMDVLEHVSPLLLEAHAARIADLLAPGGFAYINSPMFGTDDMFGQPFPPYLPDWLAAGEARFWHDMHCDDAGWPMHGHLVWASPVWWEGLFARAGLIRDRDAEALVHMHLSAFFDAQAPARRSLFVLRKDASARSLAEIDAALGDNLAAVLGRS